MTQFLVMVGLFVVGGSVAVLLLAAFGLAYRTIRDRERSHLTDRRR